LSTHVWAGLVTPSQRHTLWIFQGICLVTEFSLGDRIV
jgi:hypothetical protein